MGIANLRGSTILEVDKVLFQKFALGAQKQD